MKAITWHDGDEQFSKMYLKYNFTATVTFWNNKALLLCTTMAGTLKMKILFLGGIAGQLFLFEL
jgi:hypothetical protein